MGGGKRAEEPMMEKGSGGCRGRMDARGQNKDKQDQETQRVEEVGRS